MTFPPVSDALREMVAAVRKGDPGAYEALFRTLGPAALRVAGRMVFDRGDAEDLVQETFVTVFQKIGTLQKDAAFRSWFFSVLVNRCREHVRMRRSQSARPLKPFRAEARTPAEDAEVDFATAAAEAAAKLPAFEQELYRRVILGRASYAEVAHHQGVTLEVVRTRVYRLRKQLRELWVRLRKAGG